MLVQVIFACYNRAEKTKRCIQTLIAGNPSLSFRFVVVNDGSTDGTEEALAELDAVYHNITVLSGNKNLYYSKAMRKGMEWLNRTAEQADYVLLVNDDVEFKNGVIERLIKESKAKNNAVIAGATCDEEGGFTYGGVRYPAGTIDVNFVTPETPDTCCDTFNGNCVLIPWEVYVKNEPMDGEYAHASGDFDYGFALSRNGAEIYSSSFYVGTCNRNSVNGTWYDRSLSRWERLRRKESPKGLPFRSWLHFLYKNFGLKQAVLHGFTPYIKILLGK